MEYLLGIDAGGTKSEAILTFPDLTIIDSCKGKGVNLTINGISETSLILKEIILTAINLHVNTVDNLKIAIGCAGAGRKEERPHLEHELSELLNWHQTKIKVYTDGESSLEGAFPDKPGCILISGTGSILYGKDNSGTLFRSGGFGRIIGDEGSGYSIGRKGFTEAAKVLDCRKENSVLVSLLTDKYNIRTSEDLIRIIYKDNFNPAEGAMTVLMAASLEDPIAIKILDEESDEILLHIVAMQKHLKSKVFDLCVLGSLLQNKNIFSDLFFSKLNSLYPEVTLKEPAYPPAIGALLLLLKEEKA